MLNEIVLQMAEWADIQLRKAHGGEVRRERINSSIELLQVSPGSRVLSTSSRIQCLEKQTSWDDRLHS
ncbi:unnamed protein product [Pleuronectes platessa]|uniref:Uncharacterized protein n=1 Tax=Pleuronectes platessa TaxID=8262 RepID=A0A9N7UYL1_PLEPL|nr:unnamed protein product [Pleuronectes platessa]